MDRLSVLLDMARVLHVAVEALTGSPWQYAPNGAPLVQGLETVRRFLARYDNLTGATSPESVDLRQVRMHLTTAHQMYQAANYEDVIAGLPSLLSAADALHRTATGDGRRDALMVYASAYGVAAKLLTKLGAGDLALLVADRSATAAVDADSLTARGLAAYQVACALLRADRPEDAEHLAVTMAELLRREARAEKPVLVSSAGALWLIAAIIAARRQDRGEAMRRLDIADELAGVLGEDGNYGWTAFGPTNVAIHRVSVAAELGDPSGALQASETVDPDQLPVGLSSRRAQVHLDLAWAQSQRRRDAEALLHLMEAERVAPEAVRYNVVVREMVREMLSRQKRSKTSALHSLAVRSGVLS